MSVLLRPDGQARERSRSRDSRTYALLGHLLQSPLRTRITSHHHWYVPLRVPANRQPALTDPNYSPKSLINAEKYPKRISSDLNLSTFSKQR